MAIVIGTFNGQPLDTRLPDDSILIGNGRPVARTPDFALAEDGKTILPILKVMKPALLMPGDTLVATPETEVNASAAIEMICPTCNVKRVMQGWILVSPPHLANVIMQCPSCYTYHHVESPAMRLWAGENGLNL